MIDNSHIAPTPQIGSLLVACCRTICVYIVTDKQGKYQGWA